MAGRLASGAYRRPVPATITLLLLAAMAVPGPARAAGPEAWQAPVAGFGVERGFSYDRRAPFQAGRRRVAYLEAPPGREVRSPCAGTVLFAGAVPAGRAVTVGCGRLVATLTGLGSLATARGRPVAGGQPVGRVAANGRFRLGARVAGRRFAYLDPLPLIGRRRPVPVLAPARPPARPLVPTARPESRERGRFPAAAVLLAAAWLGLGLAGSAIGIGIALRRPRRDPAPGARARPAGR